MPKRIFFSFLVCLILSTSLLSAQVEQFIQGLQYQVGASPMASSTADFNGDGYADLAVTNKVDGTVSILLGDGHGGFASAVNYPVNGVPAGIAAGDFDRDGKPDLVVALPAVSSGNPNNQIAVLINSGDGTFAPAVYYNVAGSSQFVAVWDLDGDGWPDIIAANTGTTANPGNSVSVLMNSAGTFAAHQEYTTGYGPLWITVADLNQDGTPDLAVANSIDGTISVLLGAGNGSFGPAVTYPVGSNPAAIAAADFNSDGLPDLAVGNFNDGTISILMGKGNGTFKAQVTYMTAFGEPYALVAADFNNDKKIDLAVSNAGVDSVGILLGNGDGTFQPHMDYWAGNGPGLLVAADFNNDGSLDLAVPDYGWANRADNKVTLLLGNGDGTFQSHLTYPVGDTPVAIAAGDFQHLGRSDLVLANSFDGTVSVLLSNGDGTYQSQTTYAVGLNPSAVALGDFNSDGNVDIAVANQGTSQNSGNSVSILLGNGNGTFQPATYVTVGSSPTALAVGDFNHDGMDDLIVSNLGDVTLGVLLGNGDGSFQPQTTVALPAAAVALAVGDLNDDQQLDVVAALSFKNEVVTLLGNGDGTLKAPLQFAAGRCPLAIALGDFNLTGKLDVAVANSNDNTVGILHGNGDGTLNAQVSYPVGGTPSAIIAADVNGDGKLELVVANRSDNTASLLLNNSDGTFRVSSALFGLGWQPAALIAVDTNGDGAQDIVSADSGGRSTSVLVNGRGSFIMFGSSPQNSNYGETITLTASVMPGVKWNPTPTGTVNFTDGKSVVGSATLSGGTAVLPISTLSAGKHTLSAVYLGDTNFQSHASAASVENVSTATTAVVLVSSPNPSTPNQPVTFTATVTPETSGTPTGSVTFLDGATPLGTSSLTSGAATLTSSSLGAGTHNVTAQYIGDQNFTGNTSQIVTQKVNSSTFEITVSPFPGSIVVGQSATSSLTLSTSMGFNAEVTLTCSAGLPTGASCSFQPASLNPSSSPATSTLTLTTSSKTPAGNYEISVAGTSSAAAVTYATLNLVVSDFKVSVSSLTPASIVPGQSSAATVTASAIQRFTGTVSLTCAITPAVTLPPTCSLSPTSVSASSAGVTSTLTIQTSTPTVADGRQVVHGHNQMLYVLWVPFFGVAIVGVGLRCSYSGRRRWFVLWLATLLLAGLMFQSGCGNGSAVRTVGGTPPGSYTVTVTGTFASGSGGLSHQATLTFSVQ